MPDVFYSYLVYCVYWCDKDKVFCPVGTVKLLK